MRLALIIAGALAAAAPAAAQHANHSDHGAAAPVQGSGVVKGVNAKAGTVTLHHGPIPALKWPAMTMTFKASPEVVKTAKTGKSVTFTLNAAGDRVLSLQ
ncbi:MAG: copper-binding protein [Phenylobacterium sp.]|jgi:Cu(I)/Ag(I) efflux system protein CusF|uniref:copper-binding protein n=1 Tax=Phenylobacterium sp. TaxID=1871053 RepID=UPI001A5D9CAE|nr:copper-binding protein [Phenylobacterium sp.]MBL8772397.1 copper-binding protein [Phenylobacterium sp.]